jgi:hypothetical protein
MDGRTEVIVIGDEGKTWWSRNKNPRESETIDHRSYFGTEGVTMKNGRVVLSI